MSSSSHQASANGSHELRQRLPQDPARPQQAASTDDARRLVIDLNTEEEKKQDKEKRTFGRTPGGKVFTVPETHDMVSQLFSPSEPKNLSDLAVILVLGLHVSLLWLPTAISIPLYAIIYLAWRASYNAGIGYVLWHQSNYNAIVSWTTNHGIFEKPETGKNDFPRYYSLLKREMETKIPKDYKFDEAPVEYNTWLLFRRAVDLILMCDFTSYCCFAIACGGRPAGEHMIMTVARWCAGIALVLFNLWVKLDAHRVVKDYAWYWGDFFFLVDQELTFDGVFEMAPHPMYSVGYAGYYGISLMAASYKVLFISIIAHAAQFAFLTLVENPHIEKTYNPPPPRQRHPEAPSHDHIHRTMSNDMDALASPLSANFDLTPSAPPSYVRDMIGIENIDLHRVVDLTAILLQAYVYSLALLAPSTPLYQFCFVLNAIVWRLWYSVGIGYLLDRQSKKKAWTRHFIKYGETTEEAWRQWKGIYHLSMTMCYVSFVAAAYKMYHLPADWEYGMTLLRHIIGVALVSLHLWTVFSIYDSLGEFGWFFGDFFFDNGPKLTYGGIYRFLNNPERIIGLAGLWGFAIMTWSRSIFFLALLSHFLSLCFIQFVERPHMQKRYGNSLRQDSGVSKSFKRSLPPQLRKWQGSVDRAIDDAADKVDDFIETARPHIAAGIEKLLHGLLSSFKANLAKVNITRVAPSLSGFEREDYTITVEGPVSPTSTQTKNEKISGREGDEARRFSFRGAQYQPLQLEYGAPIKVKWTAPLHHSKRDWVGLYMLADNNSSDVTRVSSQGRWIATTRGAFDNTRAESGILVSDAQTIRWSGDKGAPLMTGEMEFAGDKLWWTTGVFELRYHHDGKHNVMATSAPFELRIARFDDEDSAMDTDPAVTRGAVEQALLPLVRNCFDRDPEIAPTSPEEAFGALVERDGKFARRVVFAVWQMFGIEFAPSVVKADGNVRNIAWRICNAKHVLAPYSMKPTSPSREGAGTPTEEKSP